MGLDSEPKTAERVGSTPRGETSQMEQPLPCLPARPPLQPPVYFQGLQACNISRRVILHVPRDSGTGDVWGLSVGVLVRLGVWGWRRQ